MRGRCRPGALRSRKSIWPPTLVCRSGSDPASAGDKPDRVTGESQLFTASIMSNFIILLSLFSACLFYSSALASNNEIDEWGQPVSENEKYQILIVKLGTVMEPSKEEAAVTAGLSSGISFSGNSLFAVGLTVEKYSNAAFMPVYVGLRSCAPDISRVRAYLFLEAGYAIGFVRGVSGGDHGGPFGAGGGGLGFKISDATLLSLELGFKYQHHLHHDFEDRQEIIAGFAFSNFKRRSQ
ncbi:MAG: hypothetical protein JSW64_05355 [Candidatus Zixiibacteriota bacterium]|nr:MAG: hypothetical protein JSW64_05355 [candidate division Zixibacteria bacterium]